MLEIFILLCTLILVFFYKREQSLKSIKKIKGPKGWPIIGNVLEMSDRENALEHGVRDIKLYGKTYKIFIGLEPVIVTADPYLLEVVLGTNKTTKKSIEYTFFKRWWGDGLLTSSETSMGTTVEAQTHPNHEYIKAVKDMCDIGNKRIVNPIYRVDMLYELSRLYRQELKAVSTITDFSSDIIAKRRKSLVHLPVDEEERDQFGKRKKTTFLDILLKSTIDGKPLSDEDVREEVDTFLFEGHDTTAIALSFISYLLSKHPEIQKNVIDELDSIFGADKQRKATIKELQSMKYLEMVIKESLRLYPSVAMHARTVLEDINYEENIIPKNTILVINQYALHRNEEVFPDPYVFNPERFSNLKLSNPYQYIPFSAGTRNCIGQKFAMLELKSAISKILRNFEIIEAPEFTPIVVSLATIVTTNGMYVGVKARK